MTRVFYFVFLSESPCPESYSAKWNSILYRFFGEPWRLAKAIYNQFA